MTEGESRRGYQFSRDIRFKIHQQYQGQCVVPGCEARSDGTIDHTIDISFARRVGLPRERVKSVLNGQELCREHNLFKTWLVHRWCQLLDSGLGSERPLLKKSSLEVAVSDYCI